jgi:putative intracellular protease/amidase
MCEIHTKSPQPDTPVEADTTLTLDLLSQRDFSALIFVGYDTAPFISGSHAKAAKEVIAGMAAQGKLVGSICVGQSVLAHHQVLLGREAAWGENLQGLVSASQARWRSDQRVVVDRSGSFPVVTASADRDAVEFAEAILEILESG